MIDKGEKICYTKTEQSIKNGGHTNAGNKNYS